jgi:type II secretory pathway pseudopilin PulG
MNLRFLVLAILALAIGFGGATFLNRARKDKQKNELHARLATLRTYEEGYALRNGHYVLLPNSCLSPNHPGWKTLGMAAPEKKNGCFRVESDQPFPGGATAPSMRIVAQSPALGIEAVEGDLDSKPAWRAYRP